MSEVPIKIVYDEIDNKGLAYPIQKYVMNYLKHFGIISDLDIVCVGHKKNTSTLFCKPIYRYMGEELSITNNGFPYEKRTWHLRQKGIPIITISPNSIRILRKVEGIKTPQVWVIDKKEDEDSILIKCGAQGGMSFRIKVERVYENDDDIGYLAINASLVESRGTYKINMHQSLDNKFFKPHNYLDFITTRINLVRYRKDNNVDLFESKLIYEVINDPRIRNKLKSLMPGELLDCDNIEEEDSVYIKTSFAKRQKRENPFHIV